MDVIDFRQQIKTLLMIKPQPLNSIPDFKQTQGRRIPVSIRCIYPITSSFPPKSMVQKVQ